MNTIVFGRKYLQTQLTCTAGRMPKSNAQCLLNHSLLPFPEKPSKRNCSVHTAAQRLKLAGGSQDPAFSRIPRACSSISLSQGNYLWPVGLRLCWDEISLWCFDHSHWLCFINDQIQRRTIERSHVMVQNPVLETEDPGCSTLFGSSFLGGPGPACSPHQAHVWAPVQTDILYSTAVALFAVVPAAAGELCWRQRCTFTYWKPRSTVRRAGNIAQLRE